MEIIYTRKAKADLDDLREYLITRSPSGLQNVVLDITSTVENIPHSLSKGRKTPNPDVWEKISPTYRYLLPYYCYQGKLYVLRVYHPRRNDLDYENIIDLEE